MSANDEKYARYGLVGNPLRKINHLSIEMVSRVHANLSIDNQLASLKEDVFFKRNNHRVFLVGDQGMGKSHRVMVAHAEATNNNLFSRVVDVSDLSKPAMYQFVKAFLPKGSALFSNDKWERELAKVKKSAKKGKYDPKKVAESVAHALNKNVPSFMLIDNFDKVQIVSDNQFFLQFLFHLLSLVQSGVFVLVTMNADFALWLTKRFPEMKNLGKIAHLEPLDINDAEKVLGKWLDSFRLVDGLHSLFPFSNDAIEVLNNQSQGNVQILLDYADMALTAASFQKAAVITESTVREAMLAVKNQKPALIEEKKRMASVSSELQDMMNNRSLGKLDSDTVTGSKISPTFSSSVAESTKEHDEFLNVDENVSLSGVGKGFSGSEVDADASSSFSESPQTGIADINLDLPSSSHTSSFDKSSKSEKKQVDCSRMKTDNSSIVSKDDNGSKVKPGESARIMHHAKQVYNDKKQQERPRDQPVKMDSDETWEPVDEEESIDDEQEKKKEKLVERLDTQKDVDSFYESKAEKRTEVSKEPEKNNDEIVKKDSIIDSEAEQESESIQTPTPAKAIQDLHTKKTDEHSEKETESSKQQTKKSIETITKEPDYAKDINDTPLQSHEIKQHRPEVSHHDKPSLSTQVTKSKRVLRVRCPECSKDFTIELDEYSNSLTCPFCGFRGEL